MFFLAAQLEKTSRPFEAGPPAVWQSSPARAMAARSKSNWRAGHARRKKTPPFFSSVVRLKKAGRKTICPPNADVRLTVASISRTEIFIRKTKRSGGADYHFLAKHACARQKKRLCLHTCARPPVARLCEQWRISSAAGVGAKTSRIRLSNRADRLAAATPTVPAWFELPLPKGANVMLVVTADANDPSRSELKLQS